MRRPGALRGPSLMGGQSRTPHSQEVHSCCVAFAKAPSTLSMGKESAARALVASSGIIRCCEEDDADQLLGGHVPVASLAPPGSTDGALDKPCSGSATPLVHRAPEGVLDRLAHDSPVVNIAHILRPYQWARNTSVLRWGEFCATPLCIRCSYCPTLEAMDTSFGFPGLGPFAESYIVPTCAFESGDICKRQSGEVDCLNLRGR